MSTYFLEITPKQTKNDDGDDNKIPFAKVKPICFEIPLIAETTEHY